MEAIAGTIAPEKILRELSEMWNTIAHDATGDGEGPLRACSLTLVTLADESEDFTAIGETIAALMPEHPARTLVVKLEGEDGRRLSERVFSQCWKPFGSKRQVCCEQVEIAATDAALGDLPSVILPLAVPDLPLVLWCRSARLASMAEFQPIASMAQRVILDGERFCNLALAAGATQKSAPRIALNRLGNIAAKHSGVADLAWTRLTRWRSMLSLVFENRQHLAELPRISKVHVTAGDGAHVAGWYFGAWVMDVLADAGVHPEFRLEYGYGAQHGSHSIQLSADGWAVELTRNEERLFVTVGGATNCSPLPVPTDFTLMREELRITGRDPIYERTLASARRMAGAQQ